MAPKKPNNFTKNLGFLKRLLDNAKQQQQQQHILVLISLFPTSLLFKVKYRRGLTHRKLAEGWREVLSSYDRLQSWSQSADSSHPFERESKNIHIRRLPYSIRCHYTHNSPSSYSHVYSHPTFTWSLCAMKAFWKVHTPSTPSFQPLPLSTPLPYMLINQKWQESSEIYENKKLSPITSKTKEENNSQILLR